MSLVLTRLKQFRSTDPSRIKKTTSEDNKGDYSGAKIERKSAKSGIMVTKTANTKPANKNTAMITVLRKLRNLYLFVRKAIEKNKPARVHLVAAIPAITSRNKSSIGANTPMIAKPITKNSTRAAAHEAITDLCLMNLFNV